MHEREEEEEEEEEEEQDGAEEEAHSSASLRLSLFLGSVMEVSCFLHFAGLLQQSSTATC
jgi:hypothetical protein